MKLRGDAVAYVGVRFREVDAFSAFRVESDERVYIHRERHFFGERYWRPLIVRILHYPIRNSNVAIHSVLPRNQFGDWQYISCLK